MRKNQPPMPAWADRDECAEGHAYTPENTGIERRGAYVIRKCKQCNAKRNREYQARLREKRQAARAAS